MITLSIVICTYNRANLLLDCLNSLAPQSAQSEQYEVIIVDNNSKDQTLEVARSFTEQYPNIRYVKEDNQGLSYARNRGRREARGEYIAYVDDDCRIPDQWVATADKIIRHIYPGVFGGPYYAFYDTRKPIWFKDTYGSHDHGGQPRFLSDREYLDGGNVCFRRTILESLGGFDPNLGMKGEEVAYGEETALLRRMRATMPKELVYYDPSLYVYHRVDAKKMVLSGIMQQRFAGGRCSYLLFREDRPREGLSKITTRFIWKIGVFLVDSSIGTIFRDHQKYPYFQNYIYERSSYHLTSLGSLFESFKQR
jgi:glycosyltransferase involved in cell wall biosynthesis